MTPFKTLILALAASLTMAAPGFAQDNRSAGSRPDTHVIRVNGQAEVSAEPDEAVFEVGATMRDPSSSKAMSEVSRITDRLTAALREQNIPKEDIETTQLYLTRTMEPIPGTPPNEIGAASRMREVFLAAHILQVKVGKSRFNEIGDILDAAMKAGANHIGNITFGLKDDTAIQKDGLSKAVKNARSKADVLASAAGVNIKGLLTLAEGGFARPFVENSFMAMRAGVGGDAANPVPPSQIRRTYTVTAEYAITP